MVRKSALVYDLLRSAQLEEGLSEKEIVEQISNKEAITAGKALRRQVAVALRHGLDFGIVTKKNNRFRLNTASAKAWKLNRGSVVRKPRAAKKKSAKKGTKAKPKKSNASTRNKTRKQSRQMPKPPLPKSWSPNRRHISDEPVPKVKEV